MNTLKNFIGYFNKIFPRTSVLFLLLACAEVFDLPDPALAPRIISINPDKGVAGTLVILEGINFSASIEKNIVKFNGTEAVVTSASEKSITALVPALAGTGKVELVVADKATEGPVFTFLEVPVIHSIDPNKGPAGTEVTLIGRYFDKEPNNNIVKFGGKTATVKNAASDTLLTAIVPVDAVSGPVTVAVHEVTGIGPYFEFVQGNEPVHTITGISPMSGPAGISVKITGQNFHPEPSNNIVKFNGIETTVNAATATELMVLAPPNGSTGLVSVTINGKIANGPVFTYETGANAPNITDFTPKIGTIGTIVTITGTNFGNNNAAITVKFNGVTTPVQENDGGSAITVAVPDGASTGKITVTVNEATATSAEDFTVYTGELPVITDYPNNVRVRDNFYLYGTGFSAEAEENIVMINDVALKVTYATTGLLVVDVSDGASNGPLSLTVNGLPAVYGGQGGVTEMPVMVNQWAITGDLLSGRNGHTATLLNNGKVLVVGGKFSDEFLNSVEIFDPATNTWSHSGYLHLERAQHTATLMPDGKVLLVGGYSPIGVLYQCEIYDPATGISNLTGHLNSPRALHSTVLLDNGKYLVVSGSDGVDNQNFGSPLLLTSCEVYDPAADQWSLTGSLHGLLMPTISLYSMSRYSAAVKLQNGKVLFAGYDYNNGVMGASCEVFDPASGEWSQATAFQFLQSVSPLDLVLLKNGDVLLNTFAHDSKYSVYKPSSNSWSKIGNNVSFTFHENSATLLDDGKVLFAGGYNFGGPTYFSKLLDPVSGNANNEIGNISDRQWHTATKLADGTVLVAGGMDDFSVSMKNCEIFVPAK